SPPPPTEPPYPPPPPNPPEPTTYPLVGSTRPGDSGLPLAVVALSGLVLAGVLVGMGVGRR
ncbi:MAG: hypothetical protein KJ734_03210, partial [Chloroflexi bacterium]|nr:hypothetical protein [Chloroflexota bacterium]